MAPTVTFSVQPAEAIRLGLPYFDMFISEWGAGTGIYANSSGIQYPVAAADARLPAPRGIAIHPQSDIDRVLIGTSVGDGVQANIIGSSSQIRPRNFSLSVEAPMILAPPAIMVPSAGVVPPSTITLYAHPDTYYHATYAKSGTATLSAFSDATIPIDATPALTKPLLALRFYLQTPPSAGLVRTRQYFPLSRTNLGSPGITNPVTINHATASGERLFAIIPCHGRDCVTLGFRSVGCAPSIRVAVNDFTTSPPAGGTQLERTQVTSTALTSNVPLQFAFAPGGDWVMLYYTPTAGDVGTLQYTVRMS